MSIGLDKLLEEKTILQKDFEELSQKIKSVEVEMATMRANLNAINGALQQTGKFIVMAQEKKNKK
mgnify:FL=1|tara:strand:- start:435 stop:629 length:195 start_codon:yes stop_codon:yes gene_type:complete